MTTWFLSDIHLKDAKERNGEILLRFLFDLNKDPQNQRLILVGDIFDVWVSDGSAFRRAYKAIVDELIKFKKGGGELIYFEGNHDVHIAKFWEQHQVKTSVRPLDFEIGGLIIRVEHGDYINPNDETYHKWLATMRSPLFTKLAHTLPSYFWMLLAGGYSKKSRSKTSQYAVRNEEGIRTMIRYYAEEQAKAYDFDVIITGHMHVFDDFSFEKRGKKRRSINLGSWLEKPRALKLENAELTWVDL